MTYSFGVRHFYARGLPKADIPVLYQAYLSAMHWVVRLNMRDWFWVLLGCVIFGVFCMRGFGSRNSY